MKRPGVKRLFRFPWRTREDIRADVTDEFQHHIDMRTDDLVRRGIRAGEAREQAVREFGDLAAATRASVRRDERIERRRSLTRFASEFRQDMVFGVRLMVRSPGFTTVAILTLAVAIAANTAIFTVVNALLFKPAPLAAPQELARVHPGESRMSWPNYEDIRDGNAVFTDVIAQQHVTVGLEIENTDYRLRAQVTSLNYFDVLGVAAALGRTFSRRTIRGATWSSWRSMSGGFGSGRRRRSSVASSR